MLKISVIGNLGRDAKLINSDASSFIAFPVCASFKMRDTNGVVVEITQWIDVSYFGNSAVLPYLLKGQKVYAEGEPRFNAYTDGNGNARVGIKLMCRVLELCGGQKQ